MSNTWRSLTVIGWVLVQAAALGGCVRNTDAGSPAPVTPVAAAPDLAAMGILPEATLRELMDSTVDPAADGLWESIAITATAAGVERREPHTAEEWAAVRRHAITLIEAMNLVVMPGRHAAPPETPVGFGELPPEKIDLLIERQRALFIGFANGLRGTAREALEAIDHKDVDALLKAGGDIDAACEACHVTFWYPDQPASTTAAPAGTDISGTWSRDPPLRGDTAPTAGEKCKIEGMPTIMAARDDLEILQTPGQVTVLAEYMTQTRRIHLDEPLPPPDDVNPGYMGYSVGKWHNNTLSVQTIGIREDVRYQNTPHSAKMRISEEIHLAAADRLQDDLTIIDPDISTQPHLLTFRYKRDPHHHIVEYPCAHKGIAAAEPAATPPRSK